MEVSVLGIRHHGPGSARSVQRALQHLCPDVILVEGPPDADGLIPLAASADMLPPVALLIYRPDAPSDSVFYPFADFSPEWQAIRYGLEAAIPIRFMDLPQWHQLGQKPEQPAAEETENDESEVETEKDAPTPTISVRVDPLRAIAEAAGYSDCERWWELMVEQRTAADGGAEDHPMAVFDGITELMRLLREHTEADTEQPDAADAEREARREAWMRQTIRAAEKEGFKRCAVICGAWHAPALTGIEKVKVKDDSALLKGLPKVKTAAAWTPWTHDRLAVASGYGAGIDSPGYYAALWKSPGDIAVRWMSHCARLLRDNELEAPTASVIEAVRLAETLTAMRERPAPGLDELLEAALAVLCAGQTAQLELIQRELVIGTTLGKTPDDTPVAPLQQDLSQQQKRLRMPPEVNRKVLDLDQRKTTDRDRSILLSRLDLLNIPWGQLQPGARTGNSTFHEIWNLEWRPEFAVQVIEASIWGNTVQMAAIARAIGLANDKTSTVSSLAKLTGHIEMADLPEAVPVIMERLRNAAGVSSDIGQLMDAIPPLVNTIRYGSVRAKASDSVKDVLEGLLVRVCIGLQVASMGINTDAAKQLYTRIITVDQAVQILSEETLTTMWHEALQRTADTHSVNGLITGRACRLLLDQGAWSATDTEQRMRYALSPAAAPQDSGAWAEGFLSGSGLLLLHNDSLWQLIDSWISGLSLDAFEAVLPLVRRTFGEFPSGERRQMGERAKTSGAVAFSSISTVRVDPERAALVLPVLRRILGLKPQEAVG